MRLRAASFWKVGGKMPPPPFAPFWLNTLFFAAWFGPLWGLMMWFSTGKVKAIASLARCSPA